MIRLLGAIALLAAVAIIAFRVGWECALFHGSPVEIGEAALLRLQHYWGER